MINIRRFTQLFFISLVTLILKAGEPSMQIWYMPLRIETITAVMMENMEISGADKIILNDSGDIKKIDAILKTAQISNNIVFNDGRVRVKIIHKSITYFIDAEGNLLGSNFVHGKIDKIKLEKLMEKYER